MQAAPQYVRIMVPALVPVDRVPTGDGGVVLRPALHRAILGDYIPVGVAASILGMSTRWVLHECAQGRFKTAKQNAPRCRWLIAYSEVASRRKRREFPVKQKAVS